MVMFLLLHLIRPEDVPANCTNIHLHTQAPWKWTAQLFNLACQALLTADAAERANRLPSETQTMGLWFEELITSANTS